MRVKTGGWFVRGQRLALKWWRGVACSPHGAVYRRGWRAGRGAMLREAPAAWAELLMLCFCSTLLRRGLVAVTTLSQGL